tara:strand:+ start:557 stop:1714 length:1158 start_codon:yes stop_codon:yes gene_type:complete
MKLKSFIIKFFLILIFSTNSNAAKIDIKATTAILYDYHSGQILFEKNPHERIYPASMTKIMTALVAFELLKHKEINLDDKFIVSENAWRLSKSGYSSMFIMVGDEVSVEDLLRGIIVVSGNDACVALAEGIAGSEEEFAIMMNSKAAEIGMTESSFSNSSGIDHINNYSTVKDILILSDYLIKNYPVYYEYFKETEFTWDRTGGDPITQGNRNPLLYKNIGADGIKTGHLAISKYSLAASIFKNNRRLISVGSGFESKNSRSRESRKLLLWGLTSFDTVKIALQDENIDELDVWLGKKKKVNVHLKENIYRTVPKAKRRYLNAKIIYNGPIEAPIKKDEKVGKLIISFKDEIINEYPLYSSENIQKVNIFSRIISSINYLIWGDV